MDPNITVAQVIGYNRYYLRFTRSLNDTLRQQLLEFYTKLSTISLNTQEDSYIWRWNNKGIFTTNSCYSWLDFGGVENTQYQLVWSASIPLKIKMFLWLVRKNKILTKDNLQKRGWRGQTKCIFCKAHETIDHIFIHCSIITCIWSWIASYNNFSFSIQTVDELWQIDACIPFKDKNICEMLRGAILWTIWKKRNRLIIQGVIVKV
jgi:zinc-binding in reverse transcriptase